MRFMLLLRCHMKHHIAKLSVKNNLWRKNVCPSLLPPVLILHPCVEWLCSFLRRWSIRDELVQTVSDDDFHCDFGTKSHQTGHRSTKRVHSRTSIINCRRVDAISWPGKLRNSQLLPGPSCQNTIPLAWHLWSAFFSLAQCNKNVKSHVAIVISFQSANWRAAHAFNPSCAALTFAAIQYLHLTGRGVASNYGSVWGGGWSFSVHDII